MGAVLFWILLGAGVVLILYLQITARRIWHGELLLSVDEAWAEIERSFGGRGWTFQRTGSTSATSAARLSVRRHRPDFRFSVEPGTDGLTTVAFGVDNYVTQMGAMNHAMWAWRKCTGLKRRLLAVEAANRAASAPAVAPAPPVPAAVEGLPPPPVAPGLPSPPAADAPLPPLATGLPSPPAGPGPMPAVDRQPTADAGSPYGGSSATSDWSSLSVPPPTPAAPAPSGDVVLPPPVAPPPSHVPVAQAPFGTAVPATSAPAAPVPAPPPASAEPPRSPAAHTPPVAPAPAPPAADPGEGVADTAEWWR